MGPTTASPFPVGEVVGQQPGPLRRRVRRMAVIRRLRRREGGVVLPCKALVVEALAQQDDVGDGVVYGEDEHRRQDALEDSAEDVEDVA